jgi:flagellar hook-basal body complex protein FliE
MKMMPVNPFLSAALQQPAAGQDTRPPGTADFSKTLQQALTDVNRQQEAAAEEVKKLVLGQAEDVHQVMIAMEQARLAMQLTVQVRNKLVEAYQEISRMQI